MIQSHLLRNQGHVCNITPDLAVLVHLLVNAQVCWAKFQAAQFISHALLCVDTNVCAIQNIFNGVSDVYLLLLPLRGDNCTTNECHRCQIV